MLIDVKNTMQMIMQIKNLKLFPHLLLLSCLFLAATAHGRCSRPIQVPVTAYGYSVIVKDKKFSGILPEVLNIIQAKSNCRFEYTLVPKNRQEILFETGQSDLLVGAVKTARRDKLGIFFNLIQLRATLIAVNAKHAPIERATDLYSHSELKLLVVRAYDYGPAYQEIVAEMSQLGRVIVESDAPSVARLMRSNSKYVTIMAPTIFSGIVQIDPAFGDIIKKIRYEKLESLQWNESGIYISKTSLSLADQRELKTYFDQYANLEEVRRAYQKYYPPDVIKIGIRFNDSTR